MQLDPDILEKIEKEYLEGGLELDTDPDLKAICASYAVPHILILKIAKDKNWVTRRKRNKGKFLVAKVDAQDTAIRRKAFNLVEIQTKFLSDSLEVINNDLPRIREEILMRLETMGDKEVIAVYKLLLDLKFSVFTLIAKTGGEIQKKQEQDNADIVATPQNTGLDARIVSIIQTQRADIQQSPEIDGDKDVLFGKLDGE